MIAIFIFLVVSIYCALALFSAAAPPVNRRGHRLGRWLAFHHAVKRV